MEEADAEDVEGDDPSPGPHGVNGTPGVYVRGELAPVDEPEPAGLRLHVALTTAPHHEPHRRADAAGLEKAEPERARGNERQLRAQLAGDVRRSPDRAA